MDIIQQKQQQGKLKKFEKFIVKGNNTKLVGSTTIIIDDIQKG